MSEQQDWEIKQLRKILASILKKMGPVHITADELNKSDGEYRMVNEGYGKFEGTKFYIK